MSASESFFNITHKKYVYNITMIQNVPSIIHHGVLCYDLASKIPHNSIALSTVQERRNQVQVPHGLKLHRYANLYFSYRNPMLYKRKDQADNLCILAVSSTVLDIEGCIVTDRNAATDLVKFYLPEEGIHQIDFAKVYAEYWTHDDPIEQSNHRAVKCAEVLVPNKVPYSLVVGANVVSEEAKQRLLETGFDRPVKINRSVFFR